MDQYLNVLKDSLKKKEKILIELQRKSEEQAEIVKNPDIDWDKFGFIVDEKGALIEELTSLDEGFETLYSRIKEGLEGNKEKYKNLILEIQDLIKSVTEKSANLQATEQRNKTAIEKAFNNTRKEIKQSKLSKKAALDYYNKMNKINTVDPQMMDKNC
ncbi:MAG: flagellar protein FliT [Lachnospiraceae bacterium]|nr:flagellar protein FliT [Lachnospiraceae bacterium]